VTSSTLCTLKKKKEKEKEKQNKNARNQHGQEEP